TRHFVACAGQSAAVLQPTQLPAPSQTLPPLSLHAVPAGALAVPHAPMARVATRHALEGAGQPLAFTQPPEPPVPELLPALLEDELLGLLLEELHVAMPPMPELP